LVVVPHESADQVGAHPAQADHPELHRSPLPATLPSQAQPRRYPRGLRPPVWPRRFRFNVTVDLGTVLSVWAHPDDETYVCGGLMAAAVRQGNRVVCVTATRGELGSTDEQRWPPGPALAEVRTKELAESLAELGVSEHVWLDYPDGRCADADGGEAAARIR